MHKNKLGYIFGDTGRMLGFLISAFGIIATLYSWIGITTLIVGTFLAFSYSAVLIDFPNKKIYYNTYFWGIIKYGYSISLKDSMYFDIIEDKSSKIVLKDVDNKIITDIKICKNSDEAKSYLEQIKNL